MFAHNRILEECGLGSWAPWALSEKFSQTPLRLDSILLDVRRLHHFHVKLVKSYREYEFILQKPKYEFPFANVYVPFGN